MKLTYLYPFTILMIFLYPYFLYAHHGGTDAYGCHTCRTNCASWGLYTGQYHCHNARQPYQPQDPVTSTRNPGGIGVTSPAPHYRYDTNTESNQEKSAEINHVISLNQSTSLRERRMDAGYLVSNENRYARTGKINPTLIGRITQFFSSLLNR